MQNRPGAVESGVVIDAYPTIRIAVACELLGLPLIEHIYLNALGYPMFMRERGVLKEVPSLLSTLREGSEGIAVKAWEQGLGDEEYYEKKKAAWAAEKERAPEKKATVQHVERERAAVEIISRKRRRRDQTGEE
jgi:hypothetical protein